MEAILKENNSLILLMIDEAHVHLNDMVNQQNCCYWALKNLRELHSPKVTAWCAVEKAAIIGPYFFEDK